MIGTLYFKWNRLIHEKTGIVSKDRYYWNEAFCSEGLENKVEWLKNEPKIWNEIRDTYLEKKNMYLHRNDHDHPSFIVYIETINEIYDKHNKRCRCHNDKGYDIRNKEPQGKVLTYNEVSNKVKNVRI